MHTKFAGQVLSTYKVSETLEIPRFLWGIGVVAYPSFFNLERSQMNTDKLNNRLDSLRTKHAKLGKTIEALEGEKAPSALINLNKVEKLRMKDEIVKLENQLSDS
jgi:hypothetical protein